METLIMTRFRTVDDAMAVYGSLTDNPHTEQYLISQQIVMEKGHGSMRVLERYNAGVGNPTESTLAGMMEDLMGALSGPLGPILMGSEGFITPRRGTIDSSDVHGEYSMLEQILAFVRLNGVFLITILQEEDPENGVREIQFDQIISIRQEEDPAAINAVLSKYDTGVVRFDAAYAKTEVEYGRKIERKLKREAIKLARARRGERYEDRTDENRTNLQRKFDELRG